MKSTALRLQGYRYKLYISHKQTNKVLVCLFMRKSIKIPVSETNVIVYTLLKISCADVFKISYTFQLHHGLQIL